MQRDDTILIAWRGDREPSVVTYRRNFDQHEDQLFDIKVKRFIKIHHQQTTDQIAFNHLVILHFGETWTTPTIVSPNTITMKRSLLLFLSHFRQVIMTHFFNVVK